VITAPASPRRSADDFREAQRRADGLMYEAKRAGGDQAAVADL